MKRGGCIHCGTLIRSDKGPEGFCCNGCEQVYRLIQEDGLSTFYSLQDHPGRPVEATGEARPDSVALCSVQAKAEEASVGVMGSATIRISGMTCLGCAWLIEQIASRFTGSQTVRVSLQERILELSWEKSHFDLVELARALARYGYVLSPLPVQVFQLSGWAWRTMLCGLLLLNTLWLEHLLSAGFLAEGVVGLFRIISLSVVVLSLFAGAGTFVTPALSALRMGVLHLDLPAALGLGALLASLLFDLFLDPETIVQWSLLPLILCLLQAGRWLHSSLWQKIRGNLFSQMRVSAASSLRWRQVFYLQGVLLFAVCMLASIGTIWGFGWPLSLEGVGALLLAPTFFPLAAVTRYSWPRLWMWVGFSLAWIGVGLSWAFGWSALQALSWAILSGLLFLALFAAFHRAELVQTS